MHNVLPLSLGLGRRWVTADGLCTRNNGSHSLSDWLCQDLGSRLSKLDHLGDVSQKTCLP